MSHVLCIGSIGKDVFLPTSDGVVMETPEDLTSQKKLAFEMGAKIHIEDRHEAIGGCASNIAVGLARLGVQTSIYGMVGDDADATWLHAQFQHYGVGTEHMQVQKNACSDLSAIIVDEGSAERTIFVSRDVGERLVIELEKLMPYSHLMVGSFYGTSCDSNIRVVHDAVAHRGKQLFYNPGMRNIINDYDCVRDLIHHSTVCFVNKDEAIEIVSRDEEAYNKEDLMDEGFLLNILQSYGAQTVILTDGRRGAWCAHATTDDLHACSNTSDTMRRDTTGAGDAFSSGFLAAVLHDYSHDRALQWGAMNASSVVQHYGAQRGLLTQKEMETHKKQTTVSVRKS